MKMTDELLVELLEREVGPGPGPRPNRPRRKANELWDFHPNMLSDPSEIWGKSGKVIRAAAKVKAKTKEPFTPDAVSKCLHEYGIEMSPGDVHRFLYRLAYRDKKNTTNAGIFVRLNKAKTT